jgi:RNA polymerase sigma-70 factor, ECF subfamily
MDAMETALERWPVDGVPHNPAAWITRAARNRAIDRLRRRGTRRDKEEALTVLLKLQQDERNEEVDVQDVADERLRLIFTCCHPALAAEARVALTLRTLCGLSTVEIAHAFLVPEPTMAQRLVRAKKKIHGAGIPYAVPGKDALPERLGSVLAVVYLVFNEGYSASRGEAVVRRELCAEAIRLGRLVHGLMPDEPEVLGLLALMLLHDSRRETREGADGAPVLLEDQDRAGWDREQIAEGAVFVESALRMGRVGAYQVQAAIAALHAQAPSAPATDWPQIAALYALLLRMMPTPVVRLNRAVAVAFAEGFDVGLRLLDELVSEGCLANYHLLPAARADLLRRSGRWTEAAIAYRTAIDLCPNDAHRALMQRRLEEITAV